MNEEDLELFLRRPELTLDALDRLDAQDSLIEFTTQAWEVLEPGVKFQRNWVVETMARHLEAVTNGDITRLLINVPPGFTKSMLVNVFWPAWEWGPKGMSGHRFISASYEVGLATRDLTRCRDLIESEWYQERWPMVRLKKDQNQKTNYENIHRGWRFASSVGGRLTGYRGDRIIIDDPHDVNRAESEAERYTARRWMTETLPTRLNKADKSAMVMIMQRLHVQDLSGLVINDEKLGEKWVHLCIPMEFERANRSFSIVPNPTMEPQHIRRVKTEEDPLPKYEPDSKGTLMWPQDPREEEGELAWPERFPRTAVEDLKAAFRSGEGGSYAEAGQLQQRPVHREGGLFKRGNFRFLDKVPDGGRWVRGWDLAATAKNKSPWTAGVRMGIVRHEGREVVVISDCYRFREEPGTVRDNIKLTGHADRCPQSIPQDPGQAGKAQKADYAQYMHGLVLHFSPETGAKEDRAKPLASQVEVGNVYLLRGGWNDAFLAEAGLFPNSDFKDQIDAASRAYAYLVTQNPIGVSTTPGMAIT